MSQGNAVQYVKNSGEFTKIEENKAIISLAIRGEMAEKKLSYAKMTKAVEDLSPSQISRVLNCKNYNIMTLLKMLDHLGLELEVKKAT